MNNVRERGESREEGEGIEEGSRGVVARYRGPRDTYMTYSPCKSSLRPRVTPGKNLPEKKADLC